MAVEGVGDRRCVRADREELLVVKALLIYFALAWFCHILLGILRLVLAREVVQIQPDP